MKKNQIVYSTKNVVKHRETSVNTTTSDAMSSLPPSPSVRSQASPGRIPSQRKILVELSTSPPTDLITSRNQSSSDGNSSRHRSNSHSRSLRKSGRLGERTVRRLRPSPALLQSDRISVAQCVKTMVEKKTEATLLVDKNGLLTGILTDRDIAFKVVALGKNPRLTRVGDVMTPNPHCVASNASAIDALKEMVFGQFRHLPVADNEKIVGILDIAKCLYEAITKMEKDYNASSKNLTEAIKKLEKALPGDTHENLFEKYRDRLFLPTLSAILVDRSPVAVLRPTSTAFDAAQLMLTNKTSAVMICNEAEELIGIFTSKDLMRRVVALEVDPQQCVLSSVMTHNPFSARLNTTILKTLHSMHEGRFLHVPVFGENDELVGLVDVLQATCAIVQQMGMLSLTKNDTDRPLWNEIRQQFTPNEELTEQDEEDDGERHALDDETDHSVSELSTSERRLSWSGHKEEDELESTDPTASDHADPDPDRTPDVFVYKLADWNGANHRFTSSAESLKELLHDVRIRLSDHTIRKVHYVDDDGDHVLLFTDDDLKDAVKRARMWGNKYIRLIVLHRVSRHTLRSVHHSDSALGIVYVAAIAGAIAGASLFLSRRR